MAFSFSALADVATSSDAVLGSVPAKYLLSTLTSGTDDSGIMPYSSIGTVTNTVEFSSASTLTYHVYDMNTYKDMYLHYNVTSGSLSSGVRFSHAFPTRYYIKGVSVNLSSVRGELPPVGTYQFSFDFTSDFAFEVERVGLLCHRLIDNASEETQLIFLPFTTVSGDVYVAPYTINLSNVSMVEVYIWVKDPAETLLYNWGGSERVRFVQVAADSSAPSTGIDTSEQDYQSGVSSSLSDISTSVGNMSSDLSDAAESLEYISNSQNLIIQGIDNVIMHISDQLYAFWDQLYNLIHVPTMAKLNEILQAIKDLDINVNVDLDELKQSISTMSNNIQARIQGQIANDNKNHQEQITNDNQIADDLKNGYDNAGMNSDKEKLDSALSQYEDAEDTLLNDAKEYINTFEFKDYFTEITGPLADISYFLGGIFSGLGALNIAVSFSLTLSIALILIGWYRFKGGG